MTAEPSGSAPRSLHAAAAANRPHDVVALLDAGESPDARDELGATPLHHAARTAAYEAARALIDRRADVDAEDAEGRTPLLVAVESFDGHGPFIELLRFAGANPHAAAADGRTPVTVARASGGGAARYFSTIPEIPVIPELEDETDEDAASGGQPRRRGLDRLGWRRST